MRYGSAAAERGLRRGLRRTQTGVDVDESALEVARGNVGGFEDLHIEFVQADVRALPLRGACWDTVVTNPPFGTRQKGADMVFLAAACAVARKAVYSLHKAR